MKKIINSLLHRMKEDSLAKKMTEAERTKEYKGLESMKHGLVFWVADEQETTWLNHLADKFPGLKTDKLCLIPDTGQKSAQEGVIFVRKEDLMFGGKIQNEGLKRVLSENYDILIDLSLVSDVMTDYILKNSQAVCKVGVPKENYEADIMLEGVADTADFIEKLYEVLSKLKKY